MRRVAVAVTAASAIEWFDFFIYTTASALILGQLFFPTLGGAGGSLAAFATLAVGFIARPVGGVIAGHLGDRIGRKPTLVLSIVLMGLSTFAIGLLPTFGTAGILAPALLVALRVIQGLAVGGQWGGAALLCSEHAPDHRRGFYGSFPQIGATLGAILGNLAFLVLTATLSEQAFESWGWRLPFLSGILLVGLGLYMQKKIEDTPVFKRLHAEGADTGSRAPVLEALRTHRKPILLAAGSFLVVNATYYIFISGVLDYGTRLLGMSKGTVLSLVLIALATQLVSIPYFAGLSDRRGRRPLYLVGAAAMAVWAFPLFWLIDTRSVPLVLLALVVGLTIHAAMYGPQVAMFSEMFSARVRYSGASLGYQLASVLAGGLAPFIMTALLTATNSSWSVSLYVVLLAAVTFACVLAIAESKGRDLDD